LGVGGKKREERKREMVGITARGKRVRSRGKKKKENESNCKRKKPIQRSG
jgi:hypothetical protein